MGKLKRAMNATQRAISTPRQKASVPKRAIILRADGSREELDHKPTLEEAQKIVGGYVEVIKCHNQTGSGRFEMIANEEGLLKGLPLNPKATELYNFERAWPGQIVGDVILLHGWRF